MRKYRCIQNERNLCENSFAVKFKIPRCGGSEAVYGSDCWHRQTLSKTEQTGHHLLLQRIGLHVVAFHFDSILNTIAQLEKEIVSLRRTSLNGGDSLG